MLLGPGEHIDSYNVLTPVPGPGPVAYREREQEKFPVTPGLQMANSPTGTAGPIHLNTDTVWMEVEMNLLGQWAEPRAI